jgi:transposase
MGFQTQLALTGSSAWSAGAAWLRWRDAAPASPLENFAKHLCRDEKAVLATLQQPWSNGPVEGQVHRLKPIKRSMYGRANFDLRLLRFDLESIARRVGSAHDG